MSLGICASGKRTDHDERPVFFFDSALRHRRPVTVDLPVQRRQSRPGAHVALEVNVAVVDVRCWRQTLDDRRVYDISSAAASSSASAASSLKPWLQLRFDYDTTTIRRYHDAIGRIRLRRKWSKLPFAFDSTPTRLRHDYDEKIDVSNRVEWKQARAIRRSRIVVVSQSNRNFNHFRRSRMRRGIVVS